MADPILGWRLWTLPLAVILWAQSQLMLVSIYSYTTSHTYCYHTTCICIPSMWDAPRDQEGHVTEHRRMHNDQRELCSLSSVPRFGFVQNCLGKRKNYQRQSRQTRWNQRNGNKIELSQKKMDRSGMAEPPQCRCWHWFRAVCTAEHEVNVLINGSLVATLPPSKRAEVEAIG